MTRAKTCSFDGCTKKHDSHGFCGNHAKQYRKYGHPLSKEEISKIRADAVRGNTFNKGKRWTQEMRTAQSKKLKGRTLNTSRTHFKKGHTPWNKGLWGYNAGAKNPNWKGGVHSVNNALRRTRRYARWRQEVFERDDYTCVHCLQRGVYLEADHIRPFAFFPELRFEISNGRTLCKDCHSKTPTYKKHKLLEAIL